MSDGVGAASVVRVTMIRGNHSGGMLNIIGLQQDLIRTMIDARKSCTKGASLPIPTSSRYDDEELRPGSERPGNKLPLSATPQLPDGPPLADGPLVAASLGGDQVAFGQLVARYQSALIRAATGRLGSRDAADEVVQETFLCAFRYLAGYDSQFSFRTWLWTILLNQCRRHAKRHQRTPRIESWTDHLRQAPERSHVEPSSDAPSPLAQLDAAERREWLEQLLAQLPDPQADALRLRFYGGLKFEEISAAMGCSLGTAKNRVKWGLLKIAERMSTPPEDSSENEHEAKR